MADVDITSLSVEISAESEGAELNIEKLATALSKLKTKSEVGKTIDNLTKLTDAIERVKSSAAGMSGLDQITGFIEKLSQTDASASVAGFNSLSNAIKKVATATAAMNGTDFYAFGENIRQVTNALAPLSILNLDGLKNIGSAFNALNKIPDLTAKLDTTTLDSFADACSRISSALTPMASQLEKVGDAFNKLPAKLKQVVTATNKVTDATQKAKSGYKGLSSQLSGFASVMKSVISFRALVKVTASAVNSFNEYYEAANFFGVVMKDMTTEANEFIEKMNQLLGIDPTEAMNNMSKIQSLTTSFGMASSQAYILSKNLTQLGYDLSSLQNLDVDETFTKLQAAISGELEPIRRLGVDLSQARLQQELLELGFQQNISTLSQADKAVLRYIAIMKQTTDAQGDFAKTIDSPANQIKVLKAQVEGLARSVGSMLYPALSTILPVAIATVEVIKEAIQSMAALVGVKVEFPDFSSVSDSATALDSVTESAEEAKDALKGYTTGIDELNVISPTDTTSSSSGTDSTGNILGNIDLSQYEYDMFAEYVGNSVDEIKEKVEGLLPVFGSIGVAISGWTILGFIEQVMEAKKKTEELSISLSNAKEIALGLGILTVSFTLEFAGIKDAIKNGLNGVNFAEIIIGALGTIGGGALVGKGIAELFKNSFKDSSVIKAINDGGFSLSSGVIGAAVAGFVSGVAMFVTGVYDALMNGLNALNALLIPAGSTMAGAAVGAIIGSIGGPIGTGVGAIIGLVIGAVTDIGIAIYQNGDAIKEKTSEILNGIANFFSEFAKTAKEIFGNVLEFFSGVPAKIGEVVTTVIDWFSKLPEKVGNFIDDVVEFFTELPGKIGYELGLAVGKFILWAGDLVDTVTTEVPKVINAVVDFFTELPGKIYDAIIAVKNKITEWKDNVVSFVKTEVPKVISPIVKFFTELPGKIYDEIIKVKNKIIEWKNEIVSYITVEVPEIISSFVEEFKKIPERLADLGKDIWDGFVGGLNKAWSVVTGAVSEFTDGFIEGFKDALGIHSPSKLFEQFGIYIDQGLANGIEEGRGYVQHAFNKLIEDATTAGQTFIDNATTTASGYVDRFAKTLDDQWQEIDNALTNDFFGSMKTLWNAISNGDLETLGKWAASYFYHAMDEEQKQQIINVAKNSLSQLNSALSNVWQNIAGMAASYVGQLVPSLGIATTAQTGLNVAMDANPIMLVISLIGMLVGALVNFADTNSSVASSFSKVWDGVYNVISYVFEGILRVFGVFIQGFVSMINALINAYNLVAKLWGGHMDTISNPLFDWADKVAQKREDRNNQSLDTDSGVYDTSSEYDDLLKKYESLQDEYQDLLNKNYNTVVPDYTYPDYSYPDYSYTSPDYSYTTPDYSYTSPDYDYSTPDYSEYPGTSEWDNKYNSSSGGYSSSSTVTVDFNEAEMRDSVYNGTYNAFLDIFQRYSDELTGGKEVTIYLDGKQLTASVEKRQNERGQSLMGNEVYAY